MTYHQFHPKYHPNIIKIINHNNIHPMYNPPCITTHVYISSISPKFHPNIINYIINFTQISSKLMSSSISIINYIINYIINFIRNIIQIMSSSISIINYIINFIHIININHQFHPHHQSNLERS